MTRKTAASKNPAKARRAPARTKAPERNSILADLAAASRLEWLEADGLGGFASGTVSGLRTRRYHALLCVALQPPVGRHVLVNGLEEQVVADDATIPLSSQLYQPDIVHPAGHRHITAFAAEPFPTWTFTTPGEKPRIIEKRIFAVHGRNLVVVTWKLVSGPECRLDVRPLLSGRFAHALHHHNHALQPGHKSAEQRTSWQPYPSLPEIFCHHNGRYAHQPLWYYQFNYEAERAAGVEHIEDLWSPGSFQFTLQARKPAHLILTTEADLAKSDTPAALAKSETARRKALARTTIKSRRARRLLLAADSYIVTRGAGKSVIAGYPWFADWGRDTFLALRGLCLSTDRFDDARAILLEWTRHESEGLMPNCFLDDRVEPFHNSVDAALWFVIAAGDLLTRTGHADLAALWPTIAAILAAYHQGTRFGIRCDADGLLFAGEKNANLTWMDAATPRIGKAVEVQALWLNALAVASRLARACPSKPELDYAAIHARGLASFRDKFWNQELGCLYDVIDSPEVAGGLDASLRPNQILAVALAEPLLEPAQAKSVLDVVGQHLLTPLGLRSLSPSDPRYMPQYVGPPQMRDRAYHNGTAWPFLLGFFIEAYVKVHGKSAGTRRKLSGLMTAIDAHLDQAGIGHISEIVDGAEPHTPRGCPWQAWSVGEMLRVELELLE